MAAIVFTTLALGTVEAWSVAIFELVVVILLLLLTTKAILEKRLALNVPSIALPLSAFLLLGLTQSVAFTTSSGQTSSLSMDVEATRGAATVIFFLFVCFILASNVFTTRRRLRGLANFLIIFGLALAVFALVQSFTWEGRMFWFRPTASAGAGNGGPFVNRNHFAGYMEMLIPIPLALSMSRSSRMEARMFYVFAATIMGIAEIASLSRGGIVSLTAAILFVAAVSTQMKRRTVSSALERSSILDIRHSLVTYPALFVILIGAAIVAGTYWVGADRGLAERLASDQLSAGPGSRQAVWRDTLTMIRANPVLGVGLGAFETVYPIYSRGDGSMRIEFAHNDYLQVLADAGIVGGALAIWFIAAIFRSFAGGLKSRDPLSRALALGCGAGVFGILVHSLFDFNLQLPSNALLFLVLSAIVSLSSAVASTSEIESSRRIRVERPAVAAG